MAQASRDRNPRRYVLRVHEVEPHVKIDGGQSEIVLEFQGVLSARAKREIKDALSYGRVEIREKRNILA